MISMSCRVLGGGLASVVLDFLVVGLGGWLGLFFLFEIDGRWKRLFFFFLQLNFT